MLLNDVELAALAKALATKLPWKDSRYGSLRIKTRNYFAELLCSDRLIIYRRTPWYTENEWIASLQLPGGTYADVRALMFGSATHIANFIKEIGI